MWNNLTDYLQVQIVGNRETAKTNSLSAMTTFLNLHWMEHIWVNIGGLLKTREILEKFMGLKYILSLSFIYCVKPPT